MEINIPTELYELLLTSFIKTVVNLKCCGNCKYYYINGVFYNIEFICEKNHISSPEHHKLCPYWEWDGIENENRLLKKDNL